MPISAKPYAHFGRVASPEDITILKKQSLYAIPRGSLRHADSGHSSADNHKVVCRRVVGHGFSRTRKRRLCREIVSEEERVATSVEAREVVERKRCRAFRQVDFSGLLPVPIAAFRSEFSIYCLSVNQGLEPSRRTAASFAPFRRPIARLRPYCVAPGGRNIDFCRCVSNGFSNAMRHDV